MLDDGVRDEQAIRYYGLALELDPSYAPANKNLGLLLYKRGDSAAAAPLWQAYLRQAPNDPQAPQIRVLLRQIGGD